MKKIIVLGAGMVGSAIAIDLSKNHEVTSADINEGALSKLSDNYNINTVKCDVSNESELSELLNNFEIVVSAVPGFMGYRTLHSIIKNKKDVVDISFMPEDIRPLDSLAKENNVTAAMDCGVAPGMSNIILGYYNEFMNIQKFEYMVGGLPKVRTFPFEYKAPFSPCDVIEEYTRPARYIENGNLVIKPAMSDVELIDFEKAGTLEAFNSDGLRSLTYTMKNIPDLKEKTLRFPGHIQTIKKLFAAGFLDKEPLEVKGQLISPFDFTTELLYKNWKLDPQEKEFTIMRILISGEEEGVSKEIIYDLYDEFDETEKLSSMARTTGFTATSAVEMIIKGMFNLKGVFPPELVGREEGCFQFMMDYLKNRNIILNKSENILT